MQHFGSTAGLAQIFPEPDIHEYHRLAGVSGMSVDSQHSGYSMSMCSSVGSNTMTTTLTGTITGTVSSIQDRTMEQNDSVTQALGEDALSNALLDNQYPSEGLRGYEKWTIDLRRLEMGPAFAQGAFGKLYRGTYNGEDVAVKILERPENNAERAQILEHQYAKEVKMLVNLQHENVVGFIGACRKPMVCCIVTEYAKGGSVRRFLAAKGAFSLKLAVKFALDIARGMEYLHSFGVIHRDLKSDNLLIADRSIKIADFGVARIEVHTDMTPETGTYRWMAPEMIQRRSYNHKVDVYSFGIVLWELVSGNIPFPNMTAVQAAFAVVRGARPTIPAHCPPALSQIMVRCWDSNPDARPNFTETVRLLEDAEQAIMKTVGIAKFRWGCLAPPLTLN